MLKPVTHCAVDRAVDLLCEGFPTRSRSFWERGLARMQQAGLNDRAQVPFGYFLMEKADAVGIALTPASIRQNADGTTRCVVNMSSWYIRPEHRWRAPMMLRGIMADPEKVYTDLTPTADVRKMIAIIGFKPVNLGIHIRPLAFAAMMAPGNIRLRSIQPDDVFPPPCPARDLIEIHRAWQCEALVLEEEGRISLVIWRRIRLRGLPAAEIIYADDCGLLERAERAMARHLLKRGILFLILEARGKEPPASRFFRPRGIWFAKNATYENRIDRLGSELCILDL